MLALDTYILYTKSVFIYQQKENIWIKQILSVRKIIAENFPKMKNKRVTQVQEAQSPTQDKLKEEHNETQNNQTDKN